MLNILVALKYFGGMSEKNIENIKKSGSNFAPTFINHHILPDIGFNGHCLIDNNINNININ